MTDPDIQRALTILAHARRVALSLVELADGVGATDADALAIRLAADGRFLLLDAPGLPDLSLLPEARRIEYRRALGAAGVHGARSVALRETTGPSIAIGPTARGDIGELLRRTTLQLIGPGAPGVALAAAADRANRAVDIALNRDA